MEISFPEGDTFPPGELGAGDATPSLPSFDDVSPLWRAAAQRQNPFGRPNRLAEQDNVGQGKTLEARDVGGQIKKCGVVESRSKTHLFTMMLKDNDRFSRFLYKGTTT